MESYLIRHGQSLGNLTKEDIPDSPLTELGHKQAERVAERLKHAGITQLVSSPFIRAIETAQPLANSRTEASTG